MALMEEICLALDADAVFAYLRNFAKDMTFSRRQFHTTGEDGRLSIELRLPLPSMQEETDASAAMHRSEQWSQSDLQLELTKLFAVAKLVALPIIDRGRMIGFVGAYYLGGHEFSDIEEENALTIALALISGNVKAEYCKLQQNYARDSLAKAIDNTGVDIYVTDFYTDEILYVNKSMAAPYGGVENMIGKKCYLTLYDNRRAECEFCPKYKLIDESGNPTKLYSWDYQRPFDGAWFRVFSAAFKWEEDRLAHVITSTNITENKHNEFLIEKMALFDTLTNIPNRRSFERDFQQVIEKSLAENLTGYILFVDLDNFKYINDAFGHEKGDELLIGVAGYLNGLAGGNKKAYRYGGDEFLFVIENADLKEVRALTDDLLQRFARPWMLGELEYFCTASIGVAGFPRDGITHDMLLHAADSAMYEAKKKGKAAVAFAAAEKGERAVHLEMEFALRRAILDDCREFFLLYHPMVEARTGLWAGGEVLPRWNSPQFGLIYPDKFIPMCEQLGLISQLEKWTIRNALRDVKSWNLDDSGNFFISLNVSALSLQDENFGKFLQTFCDEFDYSPSGLMLELTVSSISVPKFNMKEMQKRFAFLRESGVRMALDGYGLGETSLERIRDLKVDFTKIDKKFILDFLDDELKMALVGAIIMLSHAAGAEVCAEGVASEKHMMQLIDYGCDFLQGVYFQDPVPEFEFKRALLANQSRR